MGGHVLSQGGAQSNYEVFVQVRGRVFSLPEPLQ